MSKPTVSIIIPCYNAEQYVAEAIQSAIDQTYPYCEIIVIDDGSTDCSLDVIKSFGEKIRWESGPNRGGCAARNRGIELAGGDWIQFIDADDKIAPGKISEQMDLCPDDDTVLYCPWRFFSGKHQGELLGMKREVTTIEETREFIAKSWLETVFFYPPNVWLIPKRLIRLSDKWDESLSAGQDIDFIYGQILKHAKGVCFATKAIAEYRKDVKDSVSSSKTLKAYHDRVRSVNRVANWVLNQQSNECHRFSIARRYAALSLEGFDHSISEGLPTLQLAIDLESNPFSGDSSRFLRVMSRFTSPIIAVILRSIVKRHFGLR
jgi:glycosyltransferase involved in cell wall biosynthesis